MDHKTFLKEANAQAAKLAKNLIDAGYIFEAQQILGESRQLKKSIESIFLHFPEFYEAETQSNGVCQEQACSD